MTWYSEEYQRSSPSTRTRSARRRSSAPATSGSSRRSNGGAVIVGLFNYRRRHSNGGVDLGALGISGTAAGTDLWTGVVDRKPQRHLQHHPRPGSGPTAAARAQCNPAGFATHQAESSSNTLAAKRPGRNSRLCSGAPRSAVRRAARVQQGCSRSATCCCRFAGTYPVTIAYTQGEAAARQPSRSTGTAVASPSFIPPGFSTRMTSYLALRREQHHRVLQREHLRPGLRLADAPAAPVKYEAESPTNTLAGQAVTTSCAACSGGSKVGYLGGTGTIPARSTFNNEACPQPAPMWSPSPTATDPPGAQALGDHPGERDRPDTNTFTPTGCWSTRQHFDPPGSPGKEQRDRVLERGRLCT